MLGLSDRVQGQLKNWTALKGWEKIRQRPIYHIYGGIDLLEIYRR